MAFNSDVLIRSKCWWKSAIRLDRPVGWRRAIAPSPSCHPAPRWNSVHYGLVVSEPTVSADIMGNECIGKACTLHHLDEGVPRPHTIVLVDIGDLGTDRLHDAQRIRG